ncbi:MAG: methyltransferase domain-containing protein [Anaerolineae bacterium]|nr:methyltransferase domain-containing protein [Anaerolineae bacterium]
MHYWNSPFVDWHRELPDGWDMYVCHLRSSRSKARVSAVHEMLALLGDYQPVPLLSGVRADQKGLFWIGVKAEYRPCVSPLLSHLGYTDQVDLLGPPNPIGAEPVEGGQWMTWKGEECFLQTVYQEDRAGMRDRAPDRRTFMLQDAHGAIVPVRGYRGDGEALSRRGLPPEDARLLVNLVRPRRLNRESPPLLDPFAGVGGIVLEAIDSGFEAVSMDIDPIVQYGLQNVTHRHILASAGDLPLAGGQFGAVATEPPFHAEARPVVMKLMREFDRVLIPGGRCSVMTVEWQLEILEHDAARLGFELVLKERVDRKGTAVWVGVWQKPE